MCSLVFISRYMRPDWIMAAAGFYKYPFPIPNRLARCGETTRFTYLQLIKAAFVAVLETRSVGSTWLQRERD